MNITIIVAPVGQSLMPSFGDILSPTTNDKFLSSSFSSKPVNLQYSRKVR